MFSKLLKKANKSMLIIGQGALKGPDGGKTLGIARKIANECNMIDEKINWNGFNVLHTAAARVGGLDVGFSPGREGYNLEGILDGPLACRTHCL